MPPIGPIVVQFPALSHTSRLVVTALAVSTPAPTLVVRLNDASAAVARPVPPSAAVQAMITFAVDHPAGGAAHVTVGAVASTRTPTANGLSDATVAHSKPVESSRTVGSACHTPLTPWSITALAKSVLLSAVP